MKTPLITAVLLSALCGFSTARNNSFVATGEFYHRLTSHWTEGNMTLAEAQARCAADGQRLLSVTSQRELNHLLNELTEMYWVPEQLKFCRVHVSELWTEHRVNFLGDQGLKLYSDLDPNGQYCAVLVAIRGYAADMQGNFRIEGRDCSSKLDTVCIRDELFREIIVGPTSGEDQLDVPNQVDAATACQDRGMTLFDITLDSQLASLGSELNRLGFPRIDNPGPHVFYLGNKVGGNPGDTVTDVTSLTPGNNCLIMMSRPVPDFSGGVYDLVVDDCTGAGRAVCTGLPVQGKFYNQLTIGHVTSPISKTQAKQVCKDLNKKKLPLIKTRQDLYDLSAELVRLGLYEGSVSLRHNAFFWLDNPTDAVDTDLGFDDLILSRRGGSACVGFTNEYSATALEVFGLIREECDTEIGLAVCTLKTVKG